MMFDPSVLAPLVTRTFEQALLSTLDNASAAVTATMIDVVSLLILYFYYNYLFLCRFGKMQKYKICTNMKPCSYIKLVLAATFMMTLFASEAMAQEQKQPDIYQQAEAEADRLQKLLDLEDWQVFYVDSTLKHDYPAMIAEYEKLRTSKVSSSLMYQAVQDRWMEQIDNTYKRIFNPQQWAAYLKSGAAKMQKAREKRKAKSAETNK